MSNGNGQPPTLTAVDVARAAAPAMPRILSTILAITDIRGAQWRIRRDMVESLVPVEIEVKKNDAEGKPTEVRKVNAVIMRTVSGNEVCVPGRLEDWHATAFGETKSRLAI